MAIEVTEGMEVSASVEAAILAEDEERLIEELKSRIERHLDSVAKASGFISILSASTYALTGNRYQQKAIALLNWRAECWGYAEDELAKYKAGQRELPTPEMFVAYLPPKPGNL